VQRCQPCIFSTRQYIRLEWTLPGPQPPSFGPLRSTSRQFHSLPQFVVANIDLLVADAGYISFLSISCAGHNSIKRSKELSFRTILQIPSKLPGGRLCCLYHSAHPISPPIHGLTLKSAQRLISHFTTHAPLHHCNSPVRKGATRTVYPNPRFLHYDDH